MVNYKVIRSLLEKDAIEGKSPVKLKNAINHKRVGPVKRFEHTEIKSKTKRI